MNLKFLAGFLILFGIAFVAVETRNATLRVAYEVESVRKERLAVATRIRALRFVVASETSYDRIRRRVAAWEIPLSDPAWAEPVAPSRGRGASPSIRPVGGPRE
ncbi:MAG: hypothetical protein AAB215_01660 [Planctomycetota bacterium]